MLKFRLKCYLSCLCMFLVSRVQTLYGMQMGMTSCLDSVLPYMDALMGMEWLS